MKQLLLGSWLWLLLPGQLDLPFSLAKEDEVSDRLATTGETELPLRRTQWLMFTAESCAPCRAARSDFEDWLRRAGWKIDATADAHVRLIEAEQCPELVRAFQVQAFPTFILLHNGRELWRAEGYPGRTELVDRYWDAHRRGTVAGAVPAGSLKGERENIAALIAFLRPLLGDDGTLTLTLDRPGSSAAVLALGERLTLLTENRLVMKYTLRNDVLTCRFSPPYPRGRLTFGVPIEQTISAVSLSVTEVVIELPRAPDIRLRVEP